MQLNQVLQNVVLDYKESASMNLVKAWQGDDNSQSQIYEATIPKAEQKLQNTWFNKQLDTPQYISATCGNVSAFCSFNAKQIEIRNLSPEGYQFQIDLEHFMPLSSTQGVNALSFASSGLLLVTSLQHLIIIPLQKKKPQTIMSLNLQTNQSKVHKFQTKFSQKSTLIPQKAFDLIASNRRICVVAVKGQREMFVISIQSQQLIQKLIFGQKIHCLDINCEDQIAIGLGNSLLIKDLINGSEIRYEHSNPCQAVQFQKFSPQAFTQDKLAKEMNQSKSSTFCQSLFETMYSRDIDFKQTENILVFSLQNDITVFNLNISQQKITKAFSFESVKRENYELGGKIIDLIWKDAVLIVKTQHQMILNLMFNQNLTPIGAIMNTDADSSASIGAHILVCSCGEVKCWGM
ncbi:Conserved_hypothetical protein [Hexamita inflata]|uniref:Uncharacterized protein n=1 Tax=Hexamita inflata TaxID=28002 RepID=A0AA86U8C7_9EUKA|nr:Conserved hypothetical protein [Hexamita inflata]